MSKRRLPTLPNAQNKRGWTQAVEEITDIGTGRRGDPDDAYLTRRDLYDAGVIAKIQNGALLRHPNPGGSGIISTRPIGALDIPPALANVEAFAGIYSVLLTWKEYGLSNYSHVEVWRASEPHGGPVAIMADAVMVGTIAGYAYTDTVVPDTTYTYWVRLVGFNGKIGPFQSTTGLRITSRADPEHLLRVLSGQISQTQLAAYLSGRIDAITALEDITNGLPLFKLDTTGKLSQLELDLANVKTDAETAADHFSRVTAALRVDTDKADAIVQALLESDDQRRFIVENKLEIAYVGTRVDTLVTDTQSKFEVQDTMLAAHSGSIASLVETTTGTASALAAEVGRREELAVRVGDAEATLVTTSAVAADAQGRAMAMYAIRTDVNGHIAGFGLSNDGATSQFIINADTFAVGYPGMTSSDIYPFIVDAINKRVLINGVHIHEGTIKGVHLEAGSISNVHIWDASISGSKLTDSSITGAKIAESSIHGSKIIDSSIHGSKIIGGTIDGSTITNASINMSKLDGRFVVAPAAYRGVLTRVVGTGYMPTYVGDYTVVASAPVKCTFFGDVHRRWFLDSSLYSPREDNPDYHVPGTYRVRWTFSMRLKLKGTHTYLFSSETEFFATITTLGGIDPYNKYRIDIPPEPESDIAVDMVLPPGTYEVELVSGPLGVPMWEDYPYPHRYWPAPDVMKYKLIILGGSQ